MDMTFGLWPAELMLRLSKESRRVLRVMEVESERERSMILKKAAQLADEKREKTIRKWAIEKAHKELH